MNDAFLTTLDNPYSPFTEFDQWYQYDIQNGHNTCSLVAQLTKSSIELSDTEDNEIIYETYKNILINDPFDKYIIVTPKYFEQ